MAGTTADWLRDSVSPDPAGGAAGPDIESDSAGGAAASPRLSPSRTFAKSRSTSRADW